ncbi:E3 ubiquitin-protein ligase parkin-like [Mya arenaria]|uniref:E3 ubiquitin-protein ligase parkin-like n=1 Tax=Mya arenaria TaxID=6604 RepID=UPI0022E81ED2|nr:E3 ubiquitin-protein ligase parkin-like [Mya arenaria]
MMAHFINVRFSKENSKVIDISGAENVADIKKIVSCTLSRSPSDFNLLFCGKILENDINIQDLNLCAGSVLHVFEKKKSGCSPVSLDVEPRTVKSGQKDSFLKQYFVYCKVCGGLYPGKLRMRCQTCKQGAILMCQEPGSWADVLTAGRLQGLCKDCDSNQPAQFYFKCGSHDGDEECAPLRHVKPNTRDIECVICTDIRSPILVYPCGDKHVVCVDCFTTYAQTNLDRRSFVADPDIGYSLPCPVGCDNSLIRDIHHFQLLGKVQYERYKDFGAEECVIQAGGVFCPNVGCGAGMIVDQQAKDVHCHACQFEFCRLCMQEIHSGSCPALQSTDTLLGAMGIDENRAARSRWEAQTVYTIQQTTKPCPHCAVKTERSGGCMHMKCSRCASNWCWLCEKPWNRGCQGDHWFG